MIFCNKTIDLDIAINKNSSFICPIIVWQDNKINLFDFTGYTASMQIRKKLASGDFDTTALVTLTTENGGITITPLTGIIDLFIDNSVTATLPSCIAYYDLLLKRNNATTDAVCILRGSATINNGVTA